MSEGCTLDRISQGYSGELGLENKKNARIRIDWICDNTVGKQVLDVGCSQGIAAILCARMEKDVCGIDISAKSIEYAIGLKNNEPHEISDRIDFICGDFLQYNFKNKFDTVIMGEILEHVFEPGLFLDKAKELLNENGRLIVTVPFGINPFPDHKRTYYFLELYDQITERIPLSDVFFFGKWIGFIADKSNRKNNVDIEKTVLKKIENSFYEIDSDKQKKIDRYKVNISNLEKKLDEANSEIIKIQSEKEERENAISDMEETLRQQEKKVESLNFQLSDMCSRNKKQETGEMESVKDEIKRMIEELNSYVSAKISNEYIVELSKNILELSIENEKLKSKIEHLEENNEKKTSELKHKSEEHAEEKHHLESSINELENEVQFIKEESEKKDVSNLELSELLEQVKTEKEALIRDANALNSKISSLKNDLECTQKSFAEICEERAKGEIKISELSDQVFGLKNLVSSIEKEHHQEKSMYVDLQAELAENQNKLDELNKKYELDKIKFEKTNKVKKRLQNEKEEYNTLLYHSKKKNEAYEKLFEVKLYNKIRKLKNKSAFNYNELEENLDKSYRNTLAEKEIYFRELLEKAGEIPQSNGIRYYEQNKVRIGIIADEFQIETYSDVANVIYLSPNNYKADIDILFIVSTWHGLKDDWTGLGRVNDERNLKEQLSKIIEYHRNRNAKIVFYSKEDPGNYYVFLYIAKQCDVIFTSDIDCISRYIEDTGNNSVYLLPFAINPLIHNPIGFEQFMKDEVIFSGSWGYAKKYPERNVDMAILLDGVISSNKELKIFDRNFNAGNEAYKFPLRYQEYVYPSIEHSLLLKVHKMFKWAININSSKYSESMFASRVYELQACGSLIISNYNAGIKKMFPNVFIEFFPHLIKETLERITPEKEYRLQIEGIRNMFSNATTYHRLDYILDKVGLHHYRQSLDRKVLVIADDENDEGVVKNFEKQSYQNKKLIGINSLKYDSFDDVDMFTFFHKDSSYGDFYLEDMINCFKFTDVDFVTKNAYYEGKVLVEGVRSNYFSGTPEKYRTVFWKDSYDILSVIQGNPENKGECKGYSADVLNYNSMKE